MYQRNWRLIIQNSNWSQPVRCAKTVPHSQIDQLSDQAPLERVCNTFDISRSSYHEYCEQLNHADVTQTDITNYFWR